MTRRRRDDEDGLEGDAPWRVGWGDAVPAQRRPREDSAHPSGPLPQVSSGPLPRLSSESWPRGGGAGDPRYPGADEGYDDSGYSFPTRGDRGYDDDYALPGDARGGDYAGPGYDREPGYPGEPGYSAGAGYENEPGYGGETGYRGDDDYPVQDYPAEPGYAAEGYARGDYPAEPGYADPPDRYRALRDDPDDHGYGDAGGWYGDVDEDQAAWGDEEYDDGLLPGFSEDTDLRRARGRAPAFDRGPRGPRGPREPRSRPDRPRDRKPPKRKSAMRRAAGWIALTVLVIVLAIAGTGFFYVWRNYLHPPDYSGPGTGNVTVQIKSGETATQVGQELVNKGVVASVRAFANAARASGKGSSLEPGYYRLHKHMAAALAFALLLKPSSRIQFTITIPEGLRLSNIIAVLGKHTGDLHGYQQAIKDVSALGLPSYAKGNPEGYLFPATYTVQPGTPPLHVLQEMVQRYDQEAASVNLAAVSVHDQITEDQAIVVASLVQAEGRRVQDFPKIARVIYNRLNARMALQLDSTVMYALNKYGIRATAAQTKVKSPYNTYQRTGLPPGPIDSPGDAAIQAALHPAPPSENWLFFLTVNPKTGLTKFTNSFTQFQAYEAELNANLAKSH